MEEYLAWGICILFLGWWRNNILALGFDIGSNRVPAPTTRNSYIGSQRFETARQLYIQIDCGGLWSRQEFNNSKYHCLESYRLSTRSKCRYFCTSLNFSLHSEYIIIFNGLVLKTVWFSGIMLLQHIVCFFSKHIHFIKHIHNVH